jgi:hypothetical protein
MKAGTYYKTAVCTEYERVLIFSQKALESWRNRREEFTRFGLRDKKAADELLRLQADYAKAYSRLVLHEGDCEICGFFSKIRAGNNNSIADAALDNKCSA